MSSLIKVTLCQICSDLPSISSTFSSVSTTLLLGLLSKDDPTAINLRSLKMPVMLKGVSKKCTANFLTLSTTATLHSYDSFKNDTQDIKLKHIHKLWGMPTQNAVQKYCRLIQLQ